MTNGKSVLLYSGGLDCTMQSFLLKPDILLYMDVESFYSKREIEHLGTRKHFGGKLIIDSSLQIGEFEMTNFYLPYRNLYFILNALQYGENIYLGFGEGDIGTDKNQAFIDKTISIVKEMTSKSWITPEHTQFTINAPYLNYTKAELLAHCIDRGISVDLIKSIRSCYDNDSVIGCGKCSPCLSKTVALVKNGISIEGIFDSDPREVFKKHVEQRLKPFKKKRTYKEFQDVNKIFFG